MSRESSRDTAKPLVTWVRGLFGGLIAGSIINLRLILGVRYYEGAWSGLFWAIRRVSGVTLLQFVLPGWVEGFCLLWVYAACASRYGRNFMTVARAAFIVWLLSDLPLFAEVMAPYRRRPIMMTAIDLMLMLVASLFGARWRAAGASSSGSAAR